ncbi:MAG: Co2+/Mg2+ efflux protein ApaG [Gammaproteobacteria bacterium]|mgnify:CR=1 FL=1|nr:Co2+/Mg2+ efflux protein ApaG [Gammaproteobacteria bacterium]|tara:strand:- start:191 stop:562 length:372 start_codon:yes stop_codon:yes gene_type:complete
MKNDIKINVQVAYIDNQSSVLSKKYVFAYTITIINQGKVGAQLRTRYWQIKDETGKTEEVAGEGVIGQKPHIAPGESFEYSSGAIINTTTGSMKGSYGMISDDGERFDVEISEFVLSEPHTLH